MANSVHQKLEESNLQKELACYAQNYEQFRALNQQMWQIPIIAMTLTGGLWYGIINLHSTYGSSAQAWSAFLLLFASISNFALTFILGRMRKVMDRYFEKLKNFNQDAFVEAEPSPKDGFWGQFSVHKIFRLLLISASVLSLVGAINIFNLYEREHMSKIIENYNDKAYKLAEQYEAVTFEEVHSALLDLLPKRSSYILDVGGGTGRDAAALAKRGHNVFVAEPSIKMQEVGKQLHSSSSIHWLLDSLPSLNVIKKENKKFDFILVSAVWMHIPPEHQEESIRTLKNLLHKDGRLAILFRSDNAEASPLFYPTDTSELKSIATKYKLNLLRESIQPDKLNRENIFWTTLVFENE